MSDLSGMNNWSSDDPRDAEPDKFTSTSTHPLPIVYSTQGSDGNAMNLAIAAWLHAKFQRSRSIKTQITYEAILRAFRAHLLAHGLDLDAADPRRVAADLGTSSHTEESITDLGDAVAERTRVL